ncbi:hypothetical protein SAMN05444416_10531 [Thermoactinomyces sp. DSM 45892]|nr:hypothetical protein SAMN05444416_10531 [Thermoactinomyces sp. DSM 45892]
MELIIRKAHVSDAEKLLDYGRNIAEESPFLIITPEEMRAEDITSEENWIKSFESGGNVLLVAEIEGEIVGSLVIVRSVLVSVILERWGLRFENRTGIRRLELN